MLDSYTQTFTQIDTIYLKKIVEINSNGLVKLFISIEKKTLLVLLYLFLPTNSVGFKTYQLYHA